MLVDDVVPGALEDVEVLASDEIDNVVEAS